jgi:CDP-glucose 4,6-dehydratase
VSPDFWKDKHVFVTGHTGFKGTWLVHWLHKLGATISGFSLPATPHQQRFADSGLALIDTSFMGDITDASHLQDSIAAARPDVLFHLAAQSTVRASYQSPVQSFSTNVMGTVNVLEAVRATPSIKSAVIVTTDKCYQNDAKGRPFLETDRLGGDDPYSASKACAELATHSYVESFFTNPAYASGPVGIATARAGNVIGGGDWGENRLIPDIMRAVQSGQSIDVRYPDATRPWQHVLDALHGYLVLAQALYTDGARYNGGWNFGPDAAESRSVRRIVQAICGPLGVAYNCPRQEQSALPEKLLLSLDSSKAGTHLGWKALMPINESIDLTVDWYIKHLRGEECSHLCQAQIASYTDRLSN